MSKRTQEKKNSPERGLEAPRENLLPLSFRQLAGEACLAPTVPRRGIFPKYGPFSANGHKKSPEAFLLPGVLYLVSHVGQQSDLTGTLDGAGQVPLMGGAGTGGTAGQDLAALGQVTAELRSVFEIDVRNLIDAEGADLLALARMDTIISHCHNESSYLGLVEKRAQNGRSGSSSISVEKSDEAAGLAGA